jgi:hypothetical protein
MSMTVKSLSTFGLVSSLGSLVGCDEPDAYECIQAAPSEAHPTFDDQSEEAIVGGNEVEEELTSVVTDEASGLMWQRCEYGQEYLSSINWCSGTRIDFEYCDTQDNSCNGDIDEGSLTGEGESATYRACDTLNEVEFGGHVNWRAPTVDELLALFNGVYAQSRDSFPNTRQSLYWSATSDTNRNALVVSFISGEVGIYSKLGRYPVRCVRDV